MSLGWPWALPLLLAVPVVAAAHLWQLRRRRRQAVRHSHVALVRAAVGRPRPRWRRHAPVALVLLALALLGLAGTRPRVQAEVPVSRSAVIVAVDVSGSMCATDVPPNRLTAAQEAVRQFVAAQDDSVRIGLVLFAGFAQLAVAPTTDREPVLDAVDTLTTGRGTTIGAAILKALEAIAEINPAVAPPDEPPPGGAPREGGQDRAATPVPEIVVLLTDGANTRGITPARAAEQAAARGVRVYPIGFGTTNPTSLACSSAQLGGDATFRRWAAGSGTRDGRGYLLVDEPALRQVAETTGGRYFRASDADQLQSVLADLPRHVRTQQRDIEISAALAGLAALALLAAAWLSARWATFP